MKTHTFNHRWNEIVFENRNKAYGAYELRQTYAKRVKRALLIAFALVSSLVGLPLLAGHFLMSVEHAPPVPEIFFTPILVKNNDPYIKPKEQPAAQPKKVIKPNVSFTVTDKDVTAPIDSAPQVVVADVTAPATGTSEGTGDVPAATGTAETVPAISATPYSPWQVDKLPEFPGGPVSFNAFMKKHLQYPAVAREEGIDGSVFIDFVINAEGQVVNAKVFKGVGYGLDDAAMEVVGKMPAWKPGMVHGQPVSVLMRLPVKFVSLKN